MKAYRYIEIKLCVNRKYISCTKYNVQKIFMNDINIIVFNFISFQNKH